MNCPICLLNLKEETKYNTTQSAYVYYIFCSECGNILGLNAKTQKLEGIDDLACNSDAARAYITNDVYEEVIVTEPEMEVVQAIPTEEFYAMLEQDEEEEVVPLIQLELEQLEDEVVDESEEEEDDRIREVPDDIHHQLEAEAFGDYLIIINDYKEKDFELFTGSRQELNNHLKALNLHNAPKVYTLKQLPVHTTYSI